MTKWRSTPVGQTWRSLWFIFEVEPHGDRVIGNVRADRLLMPWMETLAADTPKEARLELMKTMRDRLTQTVEEIDEAIKEEESG